MNFQPASCQGCTIISAARFVNYIYTIKVLNKLGCHVYHLLLFFHMWPVNQPTVTDMVLCHKKVGCPRQKKGLTVVAEHTLVAPNPTSRSQQ
jgi:hypothetical protein